MDRAVHKLDFGFQVLDAVRVGDQLNLCGIKSGLSILDVKTRQVTPIDLPIQTATGICIDHQGGIWLSALSRGICHIPSLSCQQYLWKGADVHQPEAIFNENDTTLVYFDASKVLLSTSADDTVFQVLSGCVFQAFRNRQAGKLLGKKHPYFSGMTTTPAESHVLWFIDRLCVFSTSVGEIGLDRNTYQTKDAEGNLKQHRFTTFSAFDVAWYGHNFVDIITSQGIKRLSADGLEDLHIHPNLDAARVVDWLKLDNRYYMCTQDGFTFWSERETALSCESACQVERTCVQ